MNSGITFEYKMHVKITAYYLWLDKTIRLSGKDKKCNQLYNSQCFNI